MNEHQTETFRTLLDRHAADLLSPEVQASWDQFRELVLAENQVQNLTRLTSDSDFFWGHAWDCIELLRSGWVDGPAPWIDLGSGCGVPGVLLALALKESRWVLVDSEASKARFLQSLVDHEEFGLSDRVKVVSGRIEDSLSSFPLDSGGSHYQVISRAVGSVEKIFRWLRPCSTWNTLVLLKGPKWETEWKEFQNQKRARSELVLLDDRGYEANGHQRRLIRLRRDSGRL